ncbi:MAG: Smr/MutS family protein [Bacteroidota bacterium]|nr:Smr/MutS family protein [Bacteroidota bacterium]
MSLPKFQVGDRFAFVDEVGGGVVIDILGATHVKVRTHDGFELDRAVRGLVADARSQKHVLYKVTEHQAGMIAANDEMEEKRQRNQGIRPGKTPKKSEDNSVAEVDLHLHELVDDETKLSDAEKLTYQLAFFERRLNAAIKDGKKKLIVIHGVGEGILREEVRKVLQYYDNVQFHDADMRKYGVGATEVIILRSKH